MGIGSGADQANGQDAAWRALQDRHDLQFQFPDAPEHLATPLPPWLRHLLDFLSSHSAWFRYGGWTLLGLAVLWLGYFAIGRLLRGDWLRGADYTPRPMPAWQPSAEEARLLLRDADALAAQGRFEQAAHLLLLVSIQEISDRCPGLVLPALTSREIARHNALSPQAREVFSQIALVVERSLFGGCRLDARGYQECRAAFAQFTVPQTWQAAA